MESIIFAPWILLIAIVGEILKLKLTKKTSDRDALFLREQKKCIWSYVLAAILLVYFLAAGKSTGFAVLAFFFSAGTHAGAFIWKEKN